MPVVAIMLVRIKGKVDDRLLEKMRKEISFDLNMDEADFHSEGAFIKLENDDELIPIKDENSTWLNVNFALRYFSEEYPKGNFEFFDIAAVWIEKKITNCEIWYGSDQNYAGITKLDSDRRRKLLEQYRQLNPEDIYTRRLRERINDN